MHEWALAEGILKTAIEFAEKHNAKSIKGVTIILGELQDVEKEIVEFALNEMKKDTIAKDAKFSFSEEEAIFKCRDCGHTWKLKDVENKLNAEMREDIHFVPEVVHTFLSCPKCGSRDFEVVKGRGVYISEIVVEE
ncbi:hydrogenase nickel incorporation protein HypA [Candidatus Aciduliprofundum boonei]|uniref:Hydrogenase maturation factor HypA n=1 Tax=Aciduliprofundum boonei (strain DSM 19572 / T469) TaxID=439481 RepID=B5I9N6_ACIB4|nr:hydrogenase nickel incorporation protein HypA [Candidatus Aciduliprofundum boonei]ADD08490.1 hydrogenase expression/synthesis HypA [Aciduliprofundum boonei T469]EDY36732.1 Hydrogenase expression/synthesis hypA family [Aciduliprofundum boonei T469]HII55305.1 hydrogenase nickel incorporation protein HypA [Candidatus Aciduliprofundum boonei]